MRRIGRYEIRDELGRGGMGVVFRAFDPRAGRDVAVKLMHDAKAADPAVRARFLTEVRAAARLRHPGIVEVHSVGSDPAGPFVVLELVSGRTLDELRRARRLSTRRLAEIVRDVARAVHFGHEHGVIHRDLKPENVLVDADDRVRVTDFGLAYDVVANDSLTGTGDVLGTPSFMSPEQSSGEKARGPATDIWSIGATLYWGLVGRPPFEGHGPFEIIKKVLFDDPTPPRTIDPTVPVDLERLCLRCLEKEPDDRPVSAEEVADVLERFLAGEAVGLPDREARSRARLGPIVALIVVIATVAVGVVALDRNAPQASDRERPIRTEAGDGLGPATSDPGTSTDAPKQRAEAREIDPRAAELLRSAGAFGVVSPELSRVERALLDFRPRDALEELDRAIEADPHDVVARALRVIAWAALGESDQALAEADVVVSSSPERVEGHIARLSARRLAGDLEGALADADRAVELDAESPLVWRLRAGLRLERGDLDGARVDLDRAIALDPDHAASRSARARVRRLRGDLEGARADVERALALDPLLASAWTTRSLLLKDAGDDDGAIEAAGRALALAPDDFEVRLLRGRWLLVRGEVDAARGDLDRARALAPSVASVWVVTGHLERESGRLEAAAWAYGRAIELEPDVATHRANLAVVQQRGGELGLARAELNRALELDPTLVMAWVNRCSVRLAAGDPEGAIADARRAIELDAGQIAAWRNLGVAFERLGRQTEALRAYDRAIAFDPTGAVTWSTRAGVRYRLGDLDGAIADATRAIELDPELASAWARRGLSRLEGGDPKGALADLDRAFALDGNSLNVLEGRARAFEQVGRFAEAVAALERLIALDPEGPMNHVLLARCRRKNGDPSGARSAATRAIELAPDAIDGWVERAYARRRLGDREGAIADFELARERDPDEPTIVQVIGMLKAELGRHVSAIEDFGAVIAMAPDYPMARRERAYSRAAIGDDEGALADVAELRRLDDRYESLYFQGVILAALGREDEAAEAFERAAAARSDSGWPSVWLVRIGHAPVARLGEPDGLLGALARYLRGDLDAEALLEAVDELGGDGEASRCQVWTILGHEAERAGRRDEAAGHYAAALAEERRDEPHWQFAAIRMGRLGER